MQARHRHGTALAVATLLCSFAAGANGAELSLDGRRALDVYMADRVRIEVSGAPFRAVTALVDVSPGPAEIAGETVDLGFTPAVMVVPLGTIPASGHLSVLCPIPIDLALDGLDVFLVAAVVDPLAPSGYDFSNGASAHLRRRNTELAGRSTGKAPHFLHHRTFNQGTPVEFALDAFRFPNLAGATADVYVTAAKTLAEWEADPTLTDVRGAPTPFSFSSGGVQANSFTLDTGTLSGAAPGTGVGVGYDVVIDVDQDGLRDGVDLADGYGDEAGFYVVHDLTQPGPLTWKEVTYSGGSFLGQDLYYPTDIATMGKLPLVVVSHGNGHNYQWYDHIGEHLASYGYIVMSHQNNTQPGSHTAATTTLTNTEYLLANQDKIDGGALNGHVDGDTIVWIGHSRGGDGVVRAYDRIVKGIYTPVNFDLEDIRLISSIAPVDFGQFGSSNPHGANYHLWVGQADNDVWGCAGSDTAQWYNIYDRATNAKQCISLYGVGHGDFHDGGGSSVAQGPCQVGRANTHRIMKGYLLALLKFHLEGNLACEEFLWRQYEDLAPIGAPTSNPCVVANLQYRERSETGKFVLDDFESNDLPGTSSSGGAVTFDFVPREGNMDDANSNFTHNESDLWNGFTNDGSNPDQSRGMVFSFDGGQDHLLTFEIPAEHRDLRRFDSLSFRAAQASRHPNTTLVLGDLTFTVGLVDAHGTESALDIGAYGGGVEEPYQRLGCGSGPGWNSEFETIRLRLRDFVANGSALDLAELAAVRFRFGPSHGDAVGRIALDDIEFTND
ncbi:MAG: hypothetical protein ACF8XB_19780 [Planctomycetota bacterium JB042]